MWNMFKVDNEDTRTTPLEHILHLILAFLLLTLNMQLPKHWCFETVISSNNFSKFMLTLEKLKTLYVMRNLHPYVPNKATYKTNQL